MEANRLALRDKLHSIMEECGETPKLYFQPPETVKLEYPCIVYYFNTFLNDYADNAPYHTRLSFTATYITRDYDSKVPIRMAKEPMFRFDRQYTSDNLYHYAYQSTDTYKEV